MKAIVTGHTKGLGGAIARELLERGIPVLGLARGSAVELGSDFSRLLREVEIDLSDGAALGQWLSSGALQAYLAGGGTALLVNNAGVVWPVGALHEQDPLAVVKAVALNVAAPLALAAAVAQAGGGEKRILHVSSGAGRSAYPGWAVYCATKAALDQHARAVALDGRPDVRICSLAPGVIDTGMQAEIRATPEQRFPLRARFVQMKQQGALALPWQAAQAVVACLLDEHFGREPVADVRDL